MPVERNFAIFVCGKWLQEISVGLLVTTANRGYLFVGTQFLTAADSDAAVVLKRFPSCFPVHELTQTALMKSEDY